MGGEKERAELAAFDKLMATWIADALVAQLRAEAVAHGVDVWTWLARDTKTQGTNERGRRMDVLAGDEQRIAAVARAKDPSMPITFRAVVKKQD